MTSENKCVIFDLDGTLLDTIEDLKNSVNFALVNEGFSKRSLEEVTAFVGNGIENLMRKAVPVGTGEAEFITCFNAFKNHYKVHSEDCTKEYDGVTPMLKKLKENGFFLAVVSNKADFAVSALCNKYFPSLFDCVFGEREGIKRKPSPDAVNEVLEIAGIKKENAFYVGDSDIDVKTAHNAGLTCIACTWGFRSRELLEREKPEYIIDKPKEILEILGV